MITTSLELKNAGLELKPYKSEEIKIIRASVSQRSQGDGEEALSLTQKNNKSKSETVNTEDSPQTIKDLESVPVSLGKDAKALFPSHQLISITDVAQKLSKISLFTAPDPLILSTPPSDLDKKQKIYLRPVEGYLPQKVYPSSRKRKEPKFVPYEPYKGCVKPIIGRHSKKNKGNCLAIKNQPKLCEIIDISHSEKGEWNSTADNGKLNSMIIDFEKEKSKWEHENNVLKAENQDLLIQLEEIKKEVNHLQNQLCIQSQVNSELKKLLVASVGEDVQGKVQCLTEDKARMATMIRKYSEKVDKDYEEKEKMTIQCDVWRSKFLASSLLIDELARWKGTLFQHYQDAQDALRVLLQEREIVHHSLINCYRHIHQTQRAFDPLGAESGGIGILNSSDVVSLSVSVSVIGESLRDRLLGTLGRAIGNSDLRFPSETLTPGEKMAMQVLDGDIDPKEMMYGSPISPSKSSLIYRYHPNTRTENLTVNCCGHCSGDIKVV